MNARIVNLNTRRKQKAREDRKAQADANARSFGRTKAERAEEAARAARDAKHLDGHRLDAARDDDTP